MSNKTKNAISTNSLNLIIDTALFLLLLLMAGIGFLIKYTLLPGEESHALYGRFVELEFWGMTRHEWGNIHLIVSLIFISLLVLHIILHWSTVECFFRRKIPSPRIRITMAIIAVILIITALTGPFFINPSQKAFIPEFKNRQYHYNLPKGQTSGAATTKSDSPSGIIRNRETESNNNSPVGRENRNRN